MRSASELRPLKSIRLRKGRIIISYHLAAVIGLSMLMLVVSDLALIRQNRKLKAERLDRDASDQPLQAGKRLPPMEGLGLDGEPLRINYELMGGKSILLIFGPGCGACERTVEMWKKLIHSEGSVYKFVAISVIPDQMIVKEFVVRHQLVGAQVFLNHDPALKKTYALGYIPQTIVVNSEGIVEKVWPGQLDEMRFGEMTQYLGLSHVSSANGSGPAKIEHKVQVID